MKRLRLLALLTAICILLSGCGVLDYLQLLTLGVIPFDQMDYCRPDPAVITQCADDCAKLAATETDLDVLYPKLEEFTSLYVDYHSQYMLSYVHYCKDTTNGYWEEEYMYCEDQTSQVEAARDRLMYALADSPLRQALEAEEYFGEGYFDDYEGDSIWTEDFEALMAQESQLIAQYYDICGQYQDIPGFSEEFYETCAPALEDLFVQLVALRQQIAREAGYDSYPEFAYEQTYYRDYTVTQAQQYCDAIGTELAPLYVQLSESGFWFMELQESNSWKTYHYVRNLAQNMGGIILDAFDTMSRGDLYDIEPRTGKFDSSFEVYFYNYNQPYVFVNPTGTADDHLTFAHEFGHFCNDYASYGSMAGIDGCEVFSQGMEFLSLTYANASSELVQDKLADTLCVYVEQAAYSSFENLVYQLTGEDLTKENIRQLFDQTMKNYGFDSWGFDSRMYTGITHFYIQPLYVISYVVSNDAAFQLYQLEQQKAGAGLAIYTNALDTEQEGFLALLEEVGLVSPFTEGRILEVKQTLLQNISLL